MSCIVFNLLNLGINVITFVCFSLKLLYYKVAIADFSRIFLNCIKYQRRKHLITLFLNLTNDFPYYHTSKIFVPAIQKRF